MIGVYRTNKNLILKKKSSIKFFKRGGPGFCWQRRAGWVQGEHSRSWASSLLPQRPCHTSWWQGGHWWPALGVRKEDCIPGLPSKYIYIYKYYIYIYIYIYMCVYVCMHIPACPCEHACILTTRSASGTEDEKEEEEEEEARGRGGGCG